MVNFFSFHPAKRRIRLEEVKKRLCVESSVMTVIVEIIQHNMGTTFLELRCENCVVGTALLELRCGNCVVGTTLWELCCWMTVEDIRPKGIRSENIRRRHSNSSSRVAPLSLRVSPTLERNSESPGCCIQHTVFAWGCGRRRWARACSFSCRQAQGFE